MLIQEPAIFINEFVESINNAIQKKHPGEAITRSQRVFISFCIMAILITNKICWVTFQKTCIGKYTVASLSWMFRNSKIPWNYLLAIGVEVILTRYNIKNGVIGVDDTDKKRSKVTKKIAFIQKLKDKSTGGYHNGQCIVFIILITSSITIPISFDFYEPSPEMIDWKKLNEKLKKEGVSSKNRPKKPAKNPNYPTKIEIALNLITDFAKNFPSIVIKCVVADALYGTAQFLDKAQKILGTKQVISQIRKNQTIRFRGKNISVEEYFKKNKGVQQKIKIRGKKVVTVIMGSIRAYLHAHNTKRFIIALKYEGEDEYRYIVASDMSWRTIDIVESYSLRWLVEVFIQDWKSYEGWNNRTKHIGEKGSRRSLILSLLVDLCLFLHPAQLAQFKNKLPIWSVGSLSEKIRKDSLISIIENIIYSENPKKKFKELTKTLKKLISLAPSDKHMLNKDMSRLEPTPALIYKDPLRLQKK